MDRLQAESFAGLMDAGIIDVDPEYQREVVWTGEMLSYPGSKK